MKLHSFFAETALFLLVCAAFVLPPLSASPADCADFFSAGILLRHFLCCAAALLCLAAERRLRQERSGAPPQGRRCAAADAGDALFAFGGLCVCAAAVQLAALFGGGSAGISDCGGMLPSSRAEVLLCAASFLLSAVFEEAVYRSFLPDAMDSVLRQFVLLLQRNGAGASLNGGVRSAVRILSECSAALLFAFAHRYLGAPAVVNAAAAHVFLRRCFCRTGRLAPGAIAHFCYNMGSIMLLRSLS